MKSAALIALATLTGASAFMRPAPLPRARGALSMSLASVELEAGKCAPFVDGFDPLNLASDKDFKTLKKWRESELKHGRVAMLAVLGIAVQENFHPLFGFSGKEMDAAIYHFQEIQNRFPLFWTGLVLAIGLVEAQGIAKGWDQGYGIGSSGIAGVREDYINGDLGFDPIGFVRDNDEEKFIEWRTKELNNGRLAMIAALGLAVQEKLVTQGLPEFEISRFQ